jgi:hypothetical protein
MLKASRMIPCHKKAIANLLQNPLTFKLSRGVGRD